MIFLLLASVLTVANLHPVATIATGGTPDWMAISPDSVWVSNDGIRSVLRIDARTNRLTRVDARTNVIVGQWRGKGSDAVRFGHGRIWLADYDRGRLWRIAPGVTGPRPQALRSP